MTSGIAVSAGNARLSAGASLRPIPPRASRKLALHPRPRHVPRPLRGWPALALPILACAAAALAAPASAGQPGPDADAPLFRILFTGETHSVLFPCDCPMAQMGGAARRASVVKVYRKLGPLLALDAGGWAAGGIYDPETSGEKLDRVRSVASMKCMAAMGYDASAIGDEEMDPTLLTVLDGAEPPPPAFLSWNWKAPGYDARKILRRTCGGVRVAVFALTTPEARMLWRDRPKANTEVADPVAAAKEALAEIEKTGGADLVVLLSHLGELESEKLAREVPGIGLVLIGHRKITNRIYFQVQETVLVNFDFQARRMMVVHVHKPPEGSKSRFHIKVNPDPVFGTIQEDADVKKLLSELRAVLEQGKAKQRIEVEIFRMAFCPHCRLLEREVRDLQDELAGRVQFQVHYVVTRDDKGNFHSLYGPKEVEEDEVQLVIRKYYPDKFWDYLRWRAENGKLPWEDGAKSLGILLARIRGALANDEGKELLAAEAVLTERRQVAGAPTIFVQNRRYEGPTERVRILREICAALNAPKPSPCLKVPSCFADRDCFRKGFVGLCKSAGTQEAQCIYQPAVPVKASVVRDFHAVYSNHERIVESLYTFLPGMQPSDIDVNGDEGRRLVAEYGVERLPAYLLSGDAENEKSFFDIQNGCKKVKDRFIFSGTGVVGSHQVLARPRAPGRADLFVAPFSKPGAEALEACRKYMEELKRPPDLRLHYVLYVTEKGEFAAQGGIAEAQEAARGLAVRLKAPGKFAEYMLARAARRGDGWWDVPIQAVGLDPAEIRRMAEEDPARDKRMDPEVRKAMEEEAQLLKSVDAGGDVVLLGENCEVLPTPNRRELRDHLEVIGRRRPEPGK